MIRTAALILAGAVAAAPLSAGVVEVTLKLPVKPRISIGGEEKLAIAPFVIVSDAEEGRGDRSARVDLQSEFVRYLRKQLAKVIDTNPQILPGVDLPGGDVRALVNARDFWRELGARSGADLIVTGVIDFDIEDKAGYRTEEYVSPIDGRTYYRQVLIETTGFVFDIVVLIFDGDTGEKLLEENFRDFKEFDQRNYDEILGLFENLRSLESRLLGIFVSQDMTATRYLFTP